VSGESGVILEHGDVLWSISIGQSNKLVGLSIMTLSLSLHVYLSAHSVPINVLGGVEELAEVQYANEQCMVFPRLNGGLCNPCCSLSSRDEIIVGWTAFFDVGRANTAARESSQQIS
jgi:hypothetical protein